MKINEIIRKLRKEAELTQEQVASYLGVSAPAVNKWENGVSYPDITILPPLARVLKTNIDTLLSFNEELTEKEINQLSSEIAKIAQDDGFVKAFDKGSSLIKEYPNCDSLIYSIAGIFSGLLMMLEVENPEMYEEKIIQWFSLLTKSQNKDIASYAIVMISSKYVVKKEFEKAQQLLDEIPPVGYDKQLMQASIFSKQDKKREAYEIYERMLYKNAHEISAVIQLISKQLLEEGELEKAEKYADIASKTARLFDLGPYIENTAELFVAREQKEVQRCLNSLEKMMDGIERIGNTKSSLYTHINLKEPSNIDLFKKMIKKGLENDDELDFLKEETRFKKIIMSLN
ncbi:MAG: helix-turn-helix domain-containing protein [Lachnotalea sp.]